MPRTAANTSTKRVAAKARTSRALPKTKTRARKDSRTKGKAAKKPTVDEIHFRSDSAFLCVLLNHRTRSIRVIDFRAGALPAKRLFIQSVAQRENVEKVITLVEKDEVSSWTRVGFVREGTIPGFYKRSDGHLCGCVIGEKTASIEVSDASVRLTEKSIAAAKTAAEDVAERIRGATVHDVTAYVAETERDRAVKQGTAVNYFDNFGRDAQRTYFDCGIRRGKRNYIGAEFQDCFGHSLIEVLRSPTSTSEINGLTAGLRSVSEWLKDRGIISAFGFAPNDDVMLATAYVAAGFRKTGLLAQGIISGKEGLRKDAILWTRKLANPGADQDDA